MLLHITFFFTTNRFERKTKFINNKINDILDNLIRKGVSPGNSLSFYSEEKTKEFVALSYKPRFTGN